MAIGERRGGRGRTKGRSAGNHPNIPGSLISNKLGATMGYTPAIEDLVADAMAGSIHRQETD